MVFPLFSYPAHCVEREGMGAREAAKKRLVDSFWLPTGIHMQNDDLCLLRER